MELINKLIPFQNKSKEQVSLLLSTLDNTDKYRISYLYGADIISMLENKEKEFYQYTFEKQKQLFDSEIESIALSMKPKEITQPQF